MSENNNAMTTITKNPLVIIIVVVVIIIGIVLIVKMSGSEEAFSHPSNDEHIVENYPQSTPMNVMYSDANGNLGTTTDLGLQNLTVSGDSTFANNNVIINSGDIVGPGTQTRINSRGIIFGGSNNGREANSAQITAGRHDADALCIVGMSNAGGDWKTRRIHTWAEGGTINEGEIASKLSTGPGQFRAAAGDYGTIFRQDGDNFYLLNTKKGDPMGSWSDPVRPLYINNASGNVGMSEHLSVGKSINTGGNLAASGDLVFDGDNKWIFHTPDDGRKTMYVAPFKADKSDWNWNKSTQFSDNGDISISGIVNYPNGWRINTADGHFRIQHNGVDKLVAHNEGHPVWAPNGMDAGAWRGTGGGTINATGLTLQEKDTDNKFTLKPTARGEGYQYGGQNLGIYNKHNAPIVRFHQGGWGSSADAGTESVDFFKRQDGPADNPNSGDVRSYQRMLNHMWSAGGGGCGTGWPHAGCNMPNHGSFG